MTKRLRTEQFKLLLNDRVLTSSYRSSLFTKLAGPNSERKNLENELKKIRNIYNKARQEYNSYKSQFSILENNMANAENKMLDARNRMVQLNNILQIMDLTGAEKVKEEKDGDYSYVIDGKRYHVDSSDVNDLQVTPWKEFVKNKKNDDHSENVIDEINDSLSDYEVTEEDEDLESLESEAAVTLRNIIKNIPKRNFR